MRQVYKKWQFGFLGYRILIKVSYPAKRKSRKLILPTVLNKQIFLSGVFMLLILIFGFAIKNYFNNPAYVTRDFNLFEEHGPNDKMVFHGPRNINKVALTFDADMTPEMKYDLATSAVESYFDHKLIKILNLTNTKATLFLSGMWIENYRDQAVILAHNPNFELGNHTYSHPAFNGACYGLTLAQDSEKKTELEKTQKLLKKITGFDNKLFRFPGGCYSELDLNLVKSTGQTAIQWDVAAQDGFNSDTANIVSNVVDHVRNGSIIVMHMNGYPNEPATKDALPLIIGALKSSGFEFVTVSELLNYEKESSSKIKNLFNLTIE